MSIKEIGVRSESAAAMGIETSGYLWLVVSIVLVWGPGDALSTLFAARFAGHHLEANPWFRALLASEPLLVLAVKLVVALSVGLVLLECRDLVERVPLWRPWLLALVAAGVLVVLNNVYVGVHAATAV